MSIGKLVLWYATIFFVFFALFIIVSRQRKAAGKAVFPQLAWRKILHSLKGLESEFWLKVFISVTIALSGGVIIAIFVLPFGSGWALGALLALILLLPKFLA